MSVNTADIKDSFSAAQAVSYRWYNAVAKAIKELGKGTNLKELPGYDASQIQAIFNVNGVIQWKTIEECT